MSKISVEALRHVSGDKFNRHILRLRSKYIVALSIFCL